MRDPEHYSLLYSRLTYKQEANLSGKLSGVSA